VGSTSRCWPDCRPSFRRARLSAPVAAGENCSGVDDLPLSLSPGDPLTKNVGGDGAVRENWIWMQSSPIYGRRVIVRVRLLHAPKMR